MLQGYIIVDYRHKGHLLPSSLCGESRQLKSSRYIFLQHFTEQSFTTALHLKELQDPPLKEQYKNHLNITVFHSLLLLFPILLRPIQHNTDLLGWLYEPGTPGLQHTGSNL